MGMQLEDTYIDRWKAKPYNHYWRSTRGKLDLRKEEGRGGRGGGRGQKRKCLGPHWKRHHRRDKEGIRTGAGQKKTGIESAWGKQNGTWETFSWTNEPKGGGGVGELG